MKDAAAAQDATFAIELDEGRRVLASDSARFPRGDPVTEASWLGAAILEAVAAAMALGGAQRRVGRAYADGEHWIVSARVVGEAPRRTRVTGTDATLAVVADRCRVLAAVAHEVRNVSFGLTSVLDAFSLERPTGPVLDDYLAHLREPVGRLVSTMTRVTELVEPKHPSPIALRADALVERALARVATARRPKNVLVRDPGMTVDGDVDLLADVVAAMLESGGDTASTFLDVGRSTEDAGVRARIVVERGAAPHEQTAPAALWDLGEGRALASRARLAAARAVVARHGGTTTAARVDPDRLRLVVFLPLIAG